MRAAKIKGEKELAETIAKVEELNKNVAELNAAMKEKKDELDALEAESQLMTRKLNAASQLITGLSGE
jgi:predicted nuclease with TOPRIM domain